MVVVGLVVVVVVVVGLVVVVVVVVGLVVVVGVVVGLVVVVVVVVGLGGGVLAGSFLRRPHLEGSRRCGGLDGFPPIFIYIYKEINK